MSKIEIHWCKCDWFEREPKICEINGTRVCICLKCNGHIALDDEVDDEGYTWGEDDREE